MIKQILYMTLLLLMRFSVFAQPPVFFPPSQPPEEITKRIYVNCEKEAEFPGGWDSLKLFIDDNLFYPIKALGGKNFSAKVYYKIVIEKDGSITNIKLLRGIDDCIECEKEALSVLKIMPKWKPALNKVPSIDGQEKLEEVRSYFIIPFYYSQNKLLLSAGYDSLNVFLKENLVYPKKALKNKIQGRVYLKLLFAKTGEIDQVVVLRGLENCPKCDEEAVRLMKSIPKTFMKANTSNSSPNPFFFNTYVEFKLE